MWFVHKLAALLLTIWHAPGRMWAGMLAAARPSFWAQVGAAMAMTGVFVGFGVVIWKGPWPLDRAEQQLDILGQGMVIAGALVLVALVCITGLSVGLSANRQGFSASVGRDDDDDPPVAPKVVTTTTTEVTAEPATPAPQPDTDAPPWERKP